MAEVQGRRRADSAAAALERVVSEACKLAVLAGAHLTSALHVDTENT